MKCKTGIDEECLGIKEFCKCDLLAARNAGKQEGRKETEKIIFESEIDEIKMLDAIKQEEHSRLKAEIEKIFRSPGIMYSPNILEKIAEVFEG